MLEFLFIILILAVSLPILFLLFLARMVKKTTFTFRKGRHSTTYESHKQSSDDDYRVSNNNKPIDQSTVEYIDFEEVEDTSTDK